MKKMKVLSSVFAFLLASSLVFTGCTSSEKAEETSETVETTTETVAASETTEKAALTLEEFIKENPVYQEVLDTTASSAEDETTAVTIKAEGNVLVYTFKLKEQEEIPEEQKIAMSEAFKNQESTLDASIKDMEEGTGVEGIVIRFVYLNADGTEIVNFDYPSN